VEYVVLDGASRATAVYSVGVLPTVDDLLSPVVFVAEPASYVNEPTNFAFLAARHRPSLKYEVCDDVHHRHRHRCRVAGEGRRVVAPLCPRSTAR